MKQQSNMNDGANTNFKLRLSSFLSGSFSDNSPLSPSHQSLPEDEIFTSKSFSQMRTSVGSPVKSPGQLDSPFSSALGVDIMVSSIEAQQAAIIGLRQNFLVQMKRSLDATGRLSDVARCHRLSRLLDVNVEAISIEEELKNHLQTIANQKLSTDLKASMDVILKESRILAEESEGRTEDPQNSKTIELKIYYCHESLERILRSLHFIVTTFNSLISNVDDSFQFDRLRPTLLNQTSVETLIMALPQKYNLEVLQIQQ